MTTGKRITQLGSTLDELIADHDARRVRIDARREFVAATTAELMRRLDELKAWMTAQLEQLNTMEDEELAETGEYSEEYSAPIQEAPRPETVTAEIGKANGNFEQVFGLPPLRKPN